MKLSELKPNESNPRIIKDAKLKLMMQKIQDFPKMMELRPMITDDSGMVIGGNQRYKACVKLGMKEIPDTWVKKASDLTEEEVKRFIIEDNLNLGDWDEEILKTEWDREFLAMLGLEMAIEEEEIGGKYNNDNCEYPLIPEYDEKYEAIVIICKTETDIVHMKTMLGVPEKAQSYKNKFLGQTFVINAEDVK